MNKNILNILQEEKQVKLKGNLYHNTQILFSYNTNRIEGSTLSKDETRHIFETNTIMHENEVTKIDDIIETTNHFKLFDYMLDTIDNKLSEDLIKEFHKILKTGTSDERKDWFNIGEYKKLPNEVGGKITTHPDKVKEEINNILDLYNKKDKISVEDIIEFHYNFEIIHPFQDGNGRVGRIIMFRECLKNNIIPFIINEEHKLFYYRGLKEYKVEKGYLTDTCLSSQDEYIKLVDKFLN